MLHSSVDTSEKMRNLKRNKWRRFRTVSITASYVKNFTNFLKIKYIIKQQDTVEDVSPKYFIKKTRTFQLVRVCDDNFHKDQFLTSLSSIILYLFITRFLISVILVLFFRVFLNLQL